jgi:hypothetical protein
MRIARDCELREDLHSIRIATATDDAQALLSECLAQLGFELFEAALDDLHKLMVVFLRHESSRGRRTVVIMENTEHCGPHVFQLMQSLSQIRAGTTPAITFVLTGSRELHHVLDSPGMSGLRPFTRQRFDLERWLDGANDSAVAAPRIPEAGAAAREAQRTLVVLRDGTPLEQRELLPGRLVIGRSRDSGLCLDDQYVSRYHAALLVNAGEVVIVDLKSTNATLVNGKATASQKLEHGDIVAIGKFRLRFDDRTAARIT